ncbi:DUF4388 domain-containing protein [Desulfolithobacter sp.]
MVQESGSPGTGSIGGVSLASFLQILEQERRSCTLIVHCDDGEGQFFFDEGDLVDAQCGDKAGEDAVYALLTAKDPVFRVEEARDRLRRISLPLAHLLLNAATRQDEAVGEQKRVIDTMHSPRQAMNAAVQGNPALRRLVNAIVSIAGVKHYYILNRQGKVIVQSSKNRKVGDFITYCVVSGIQIRKALEARGPHQIRLELEGGDVLLILPGAGMIIGLLLDQDASVSEVTAVLRSSLSAG